MESPENTNDLSENSDSPPKKPAQKWYPYFLLNGNLKEKQLKQAFEILDCPTRDDVETAIIESKFHPSGKYRVEKKKNGVTTEFFYCEKPEMSFFKQATHNPNNKIESDVEDSDEIDFEEPPSQLENLLSLLIQKVEDLETKVEDRQVTAGSSSNEMLTLQLLREMQKQGERNVQQSEKSFQQGLQMAQMILQSQQQKENPTELMLSMLQGTLAIQKGVRELGEEISPPESKGGGTFLDGAANLVNSLGKNAGTFLPIISGAFGGNRQPISPQPIRPQTPIANGANGSDQNGDLSELLKKAKQGVKK